MSPTLADQSISTLQVTKEEWVKAPIEVVFETLLQEIGPRYAGPTGTSLHLKIEPWPGGRWFRDLGNNAGYFWGHVQSIKPPTLLEIYGPMFMSSSVVCQAQFRLVAEGERVRITIVNHVMGPIPPSFRDGTHLHERWGAILASVRASAEAPHNL